MVDSRENLVLTQLRAIPGDISDVQGSLTEIKRRLTNLESGQASIIQHLGNGQRQTLNSSSQPMD